MNEIIRAIKERRSIRRFRPELPDKALLDEIIEAGLYAPCGAGKQAAIIVAVTDKALRDEIAEDNRKIGGWKEGFDPFYGAPAVFIVLRDKSWVTSLQDGSLVLGNMLLAAHALGLGGIWIHRAKEEFEMEKYQALLRKLGIEGDYEGVGHCAVGYIDGEVPAAAPRKENRVFYAE